MGSEAQSGRVWEWEVGRVSGGSGREGKGKKEEKGGAGR